MGDVLLGFCHQGSVYTPFMMSVLEMLSYEGSNGPSRLYSYSALKHPVIADARNALVREFLATPCQWLWMLDPDIQFAPQTLRLLLAVADPQEVPIVAAPYWNEYSGGKRCLTWLGGSVDAPRPFKRLPEEDVLAELVGCGMGCTLIHRNVLDALREAHKDDPWPWFGYDRVTVAGTLERAGEDVTFCLRARRLGFKTYGYGGALVEHYKPHYMEHGARELVPA